MAFPTHYDTLEVTENASDEVIKGAYRFLSQKWHPDKNPGRREEAARVMQALNEAYAVLSDSARRREYDAWLASRRAGQDTAAGARPEPDIGSPSRRDQYIKEMASNAAESFGAMLACAVTAACIMAASLSTGLREVFFGNGFFRFSLVLLILVFVTDFILAARRKLYLAGQDMSTLTRMYEQHQRKKNAKLVILWFWLLLIATMLFTYRDTVRRPLPAAAPAPVSEPAPLLVRNDCHRPIRLAVHYLTADRWQTEGMFVFQPGESSRMVRDTANGSELIQSTSGLFYYFATSLDGRMRWAGDEANPEHKSVLVGDGHVRFRSIQLERDGAQNAFVLALTCPSRG